MHWETENCLILNKIQTYFEYKNVTLRDQSLNYCIVEFNIFLIGWGAINFMEKFSCNVKN